MIRFTDLSSSATELSVSSGVFESDFSDNFSESTLSRSNSLERLKLTEGYVEERFRVDRRKLEAMIMGCLPGPWDTEVVKIPIDKHGKIKSAAEFFEEIMAITNTIIKYPKYLKIGGKNKKDPYVQVIGFPGSVSDAAQLIRYEMQPSTKITMKMDVSWTCHSHIIGKGGNTIQPVVKRTGVSIHFPDGNKNSEIFKSNQVSVNSRGRDVSGLEEARRAIRELTPLVFTFSLPASAQFINGVDFSIMVTHVQSRYNVQAEVSLKNEDTLVGSVKGTEWDAERVKEATLWLLKALCGNLANQMTVQVTMDISPQHHQFVLGPNYETVRKIMQRTATKIEFPDANDSCLLPVNRSSVRISGAIENVYLARQNLIGCLPLVLMFDLMPNQTVGQVELTQIMQTLDVFVVVKNRRADGRWSAIIKGAERNASNIYEAWRMVNKKVEAVPKAKIPPTYYLTERSPLYGIGPCLSPVFLNTFAGMFIDASAQNLCPRSYCTDMSCFPSVEDNIPETPTSPCSNARYQEQTSVNWQNMCNSTNINGTNAHTNICGPIVNGTNFKGANINGSNVQTVNGTGVHGGSPLTESVLLEKVEALLRLTPDRRAPGYEKKQGFDSDYLTKKLLATKVMKQPVLPEPRMPTSTWSGYGFSKSQPAYLLNHLKEEAKFEETLKNGWCEWSKENSVSFPSTYEDSISSHFEEKPLYIVKEDPMIAKSNGVKSASNFLDALFPSLTPTVQHQNINDIHSVLVTLEMEQYKDSFDSHELDFESFCMLNDQDLQDLGVTSFGHRIKLLRTIKNLNCERRTGTQRMT